MGPRRFSEEARSRLPRSLSHSFVSLRALTKTEAWSLTDARSPIAVKKGTVDQVDEDLTANPYPTWKKLEEMVDKGKVRNIGVSK